MHHTLPFRDVFCRAFLYFFACYAHPDLVYLLCSLDKRRRFERSRHRHSYNKYKGLQTFEEQLLLSSKTFRTRHYWFHRSEQVTFHADSYNYLSSLNYIYEKGIQSRFAEAVPVH